MPEGSWEVYLRDEKVVFVVRGYHSHEHAIACAEKTLDLFRAMGPGEFVVDMRDATGFESAGRAFWQDKLKELRPFVHTLTMVGGPGLVRMAGAAVCLYAGIKMKTATAIEDVFGRDASTRSA
jgi:hypothetical protein